MIDRKELITGVIQTDNKEYSFHLNNFSMIFLDAVVNSGLTSNLHPNDGFATAFTHNGFKMLIYIGEHDHPVTNTMTIGLSSYIISTSNIIDFDLTHFDGIEFVGGSISKLKSPKAFITKYDEITKRTYIEKNNDEQTFSFATEDFVCDVKIGSHTSEKRSLHTRSITNDKVYFSMMFNKRQTTSSIYKHYNKVCELLSFLTNRKCVGVEEIYLLQKNVQYGATTLNIHKTARVFIQNDDILSQKQPYHNLEFALLGNSLGRLLEILYSTKERKKSYSLGFYPYKDDDANLINNQIVRDVCSALECEISFIKDIKSEETKRIKELKKKIIPIIEEHKLSNDKLRDKTYSLIETSMDHWSMAASDQIKALFHRYDDEMKIIADRALMTVGDDEIDAFVKYRNDITHGSYRVLDRKIAYTTHLLTCLVYCCILTRIGVPRESIKSWFNDGRLLH